MTTAFLVIGLIGLALLVASVVFGEILDGLFDAFDFDTDIGGDGTFSSVAVATFLTGFGFAGWIALETGAVVTWLALIIALVTAVVLGGIAGRFVGSAMNMKTDATPTRDDLLGRLGVVTTRIPDDGLGQIRAELSGTPIKLSARSDEAPLAAGTEIVVMEVLTETSVRVSTETAVFDNPPTRKALE